MYFRIYCCYSQNLSLNLNCSSTRELKNLKLETEMVFLFCLINSPYSFFVTFLMTKSMENVEIWLLIHSDSWQSRFSSQLRWRYLSASQRSINSSLGTLYFMFHLMHIHNAFVFFRQHARFGCCQRTMLYDPFLFLLPFFSLFVFLFEIGRFLYISHREYYYTTQHTLVIINPPHLDDFQSNNTYNNGELDHIELWLYVQYIYVNANVESNDNNYHAIYHYKIYPFTYILYPYTRNQPLPPPPRSSSLRAYKYTHCTHE